MFLQKTRDLFKSLYKLEHPWSRLSMSFLDISCLFVCKPKTFMILIKCQNKSLAYIWSFVKIVNIKNDHANLDNLF